MQNPISAPISRRALLAGTVSATALVALPACVTHPAAAQASTNAEGQALLDDIAWSLIHFEPTRATGLGIDTGEHAALRGAMGDVSPEGIAAHVAALRDNLQRARAFPKHGLDFATATSFAVVESAYATALDGYALPYGDVAVGGWRNAPYAVIQNVGSYLDLPRFFDTDQPLREEADVAAFVSRLSAVPAVLEGELVRIAAAREMGVVPPDFLLDKAIPQMEATLTDGAIWSAALHRSTLPGAAAAARDADRIVREGITPALARQLAELRAQRAVATADPGMATRPHGDEWYRWALRASTTTRRSPEEIHTLGRETLANIHREMDAILRDLGYTEGSPGARMIELSADPRFRFAEGDPGRAEIMAFIEERIAWIRAAMPRAFTRTVTANLEVRRLPLAEEPSAPTAYGGAGSVDGSIPGRMWINLHTTDLHRRYDLPTLVHHETIPGHVWQGEYSNQLPLIRSMLAFNAFSEGWALYAEQLADELGAYTGNPAWRLGYLGDQAYRAVRLVVDTGLHTMGWSRAEAFAFFQSNLGKDDGESNNEIDRYCSWPGQACGYMVGKLEILRQRARAQAQLSDRYDLRAFNQAVVEGGNVPLDVLDANITQYMANAAA